MVAGRVPLFFTWICNIMDVPGASAQGFDRISCSMAPGSCSISGVMDGARCDGLGSLVLKIDAF